MILNTSSEAKILSTRVTKSKAYITLLIHSKDPQEIRDKDNPLEVIRPNRVFQVYIQENGSFTPLSNINYWIDNNNNYDNDLLNVDINRHKEITLEVDITRNGLSPMKGLRWVRECRIILRDVTREHINAWISEPLTLVSDEVELPEIQETKIFSLDDFERLHVGVLFKYKSHQNFSYTNQNLYTAISIRSNQTQQVLESALLYEEQMGKGWVGYTFNTKYDIFIVVDIEVKNLRGETLLKRSQLYRPYIQNFSLYVKHNGEVRRGGAVYVK